MKELTLFYLENCPYCKKARTYIQQLQAENPKYAAIPIRMVEETQQKALADTYSYYYVPCFFADEEKLAEGSVDKAGVRKVFDLFLAL